MLRFSVELKLWMRVTAPVRGTGAHPQSGAVDKEGGDRPVDDAQDLESLRILVVGSTVGKGF